jgi:adenylate cyclase
MWFEDDGNSQKQADDCSLRALQLAPDMAEAHASRGYALTMNGKYAEAQAEFKAASRLDPQLYEAYYYAGRAYFAEGKYRQAADAFSKAGDIRPDDITVASLKSTALGNFGSEEEKREVREHSVRVAERYLALNPDDALALSRAANDLILLGEVSKGLERAERAYAINPHVCRYNVACAHMLAGKTARALDLLEEHARAGAVHVDWVEQDGDWAEVRDDPRFKEILDIARQSS